LRNNGLAVLLFDVATGPGGESLMKDYEDQILQQKGIKGLLLYLSRHLLLLVIGGLVLFLPCYLVFYLAITYGG
jgi:hypothetical protein